MFVKQGAFGKFFHYRDLPLENTGVRPNRDTLYSLAVFDLDAFRSFSGQLVSGFRRVNPAPSEF
jgi:hypothetical protein